MQQEQKTSGKLEPVPIARACDDGEGDARAMDEKLAHYQREGWTVFPKLLDAQGLQDARIACDERLAADDDPHWLMDVHTGERGAWLIRLLLSPSFTSLLRSFCGAGA